MTVYALVATAAIAGANGLLALAYWWRRRESAAHLWFCGVMITYAALALARLSQMLGTWADRPWLPARGVVCTIVLGAWTSFEFAAAFAGQRPSRAARTLVGALAAVPLLLALTTDLMITETPVVRRLWAGEQFIGVELGPLYFTFSISVLTLWVMGVARLARRRGFTSRADEYLLITFGGAFLVMVFDFVCIALRIQAPRLGDYALLPVAFAFTFAEVDRYAGLFGALEERVRARTRDLAEASQELTRKHAEREALQRRLAAVQRLEALGELARGVSHDFNNLLAIVSASNELIAGVDRSTPEIAAACARIRTACEGGTALVRQLVTSARQEPVAPRAVDLAEQVRARLPLLESLAGSAVRLRVEGNAPARVLIDPTQFDQILMNLIVNARAAMPAGGDVVIRVQPQRAMRPGDSLPDASPGDGTVLVTVSDTGTGIPAEVLPRIFEPFFTTKTDEGTGLGLATVQRAVREAGGELSVESEVAAGTTFRILLPILREKNTATAGV